MVRQASEDVGEPGTRVDAVELRGFDQGVHGGSASPSGVGSVEGPVATAYRDGANGALGGVSRVPSYSLIETCVRLGVWVLGPPESNRRLSGHSKSCGADQAASKQAFRKTEKGRQRPVARVRFARASSPNQTDRFRPAPIMAALRPKWPLRVSSAFLQSRHLQPKSST
jgi:hypothetical protein